MQPDAIAFDAFGTLFDLEALRETLGDEVFQGFAERLVPWTWHVTAAGTFSPLPEIACAAAAAAGATEDQVAALPGRLRELPAFPDVAAGLEALAPTRLAVLSNGTAEGVRSLVENAGLSDRFEHLLSADQAGCYKPSRELYALAPRAFRTRADRVLLVSSNEWDVAGAASAGLRTAWLARGRTPSWVLGIEAEMSVDSLPDLQRALG
jgi:2-haloacid dehalogenase